MVESELLSYTEEYINQLTKDLSTTFLSTSVPPIDITLNDKIARLERLEKKLIRTRLHGHLFTRYLQENIIPVGLQIKIEPVIFVDVPKFKEGFSYVANNCSRHWMVLGVETAAEQVVSLSKEIADLKAEILGDNTLTKAKEALDSLEVTIKDFDTTAQTKKLEKLARDLRLFDKKLVYPYLQPDYFKQDNQGRFTNRGRGGYRGRQNYTTFSDSSYSSGSEVEAGPSTSYSYPPYPPQDTTYQQYPPQFPPHFLDQGRGQWRPPRGRGNNWPRGQSRGQQQQQNQAGWEGGRGKQQKRVTFRPEVHGEISTRRNTYRW